MRPQRRPKGELSGTSFGRTHRAALGTGLADDACFADCPLWVALAAPAAVATRPAAVPAGPAAVPAGPAAVPRPLVTVAAGRSGATSATPRGDDTVNGVSGVASRAACA